MLFSHILVIFKLNVTFAYATARRLFFTLSSIAGDSLWCAATIRQMRPRTVIVTSY